MKKIILYFVLAVLFSTSFNINKASAQESLYKRLGGYDAIAAVVDDFIPRLVMDPALSKFFMGASDDSKMRIRQMVVDQVCAATGGPCVYIGKSMKQAHKGLGISEMEWTASANHFVESLKKFNVPEKESNELVAIIVSLKGDIVEK